MRPAEYAINKYLHEQEACQSDHKLDEAQLDEQVKIRWIWSKLPSSIKKVVTLKKLADYLADLEEDGTLESAAGVAGISTSISINLMRALEGIGLV